MANECNNGKENAKKMTKWIKLYKSEGENSKKGVGTRRNGKKLFEVQGNGS